MSARASCGASHSDDSSQSLPTPQLALHTAIERDGCTGNYAKILQALLCNAVLRVLFLATVGAVADEFRSLFTKIKGDRNMDLALADLLDSRLGREQRGAFQVARLSGQSDVLQRRVHSDRRAELDKYGKDSVDLVSLHCDRHRSVSSRVGGVGARLLQRQQLEDSCEHPKHGSLEKMIVMRDYLHKTSKTSVENVRAALRKAMKELADREKREVVIELVV